VTPGAIPPTPHSAVWRPDAQIERTESPPQPARRSPGRCLVLLRSMSWWNAWRGGSAAMTFLTPATPGRQVGRNGRRVRPRSARCYTTTTGRSPARRRAQGVPERGPPWGSRRSGRVSLGSSLRYSAISEVQFRPARARRPSALLPLFAHTWPTLRPKLAAWPVAPAVDVPWARMA
jgi:hypothetical protein